MPWLNNHRTYGPHALRRYYAPYEWVTRLRPWTRAVSLSPDHEDGTLSVGLCSPPFHRPVRPILTGSCIPLRGAASLCHEAEAQPHNRGLLQVFGLPALKGGKSGHAHLTHVSPHKFKCSSACLEGFEHRRVYGFKER